MVRSAVFNRLRVLSPLGLRLWFKRQPWFAPVSRVLFGNTVYCESYFNDVERIEGASVPPIAQWISTNLKPKRLIDVGCGPGHMMEGLTKLGVETFGVDISDAALTATHAKGLKCQKFDLTQTKQPLPGIPYDVAMSCEVAEHLEEKFASGFVDHLCAAAPVIYITAAEPNNEFGVGLFHHNEQEHSYWIKLFTDRGYWYDEPVTEDARRVFKENHVISYLARAMVFRKR